jgi:hypothetical protein
MAKRKLFGNVAKKAMTRFMDKVGSKVVSGMADTSADAPSARFEPKRDLYRQMKEGETSAAAQASSEEPGKDPEGES